MRLRLFELRSQSLKTSQGVQVARMAFSRGEAAQCLWRWALTVDLYNAVAAR